MRKLISVCLLFFCFTCFAQKRGNVWCFGDSAGIDFSNLSNPVPIATGMRSRGSCTSISDTSGQLLFYANDRTNTSGDYTTLVYNKLHQIMPNGDTIVGEDWYNELTIVPFPDNDSLYYLFSLSTALGPKGLYYSIINMNADNGNGDVIAKNIQLQSFSLIDCLVAIKHGNGRDWWLIFRRYDGTGATVNNEFYSYLISPSGISSVLLQNVGSMMNTALGQLKFNREGNKMVFNSSGGTLELFDFDRCSGILSNPVLLFNQNPIPPWPYRWSSEFSANSNYLYVCNNPDTTYLFQYDLTAPNIVATEDTIWTTNFPRWCGGLLKRGPDDKIYFSCVYDNGVQFPYPYADSMYNSYNMNLGVINSPNNLGSACDFQPYSFYLGGKRTYWGLPNNPDYDMPALTGSSCDTLLSISEPASLQNPNLFVYYDPTWQTTFINAQKLKGHAYHLSVYDLLGNEVFKEEGQLHPPYFTKNLNCSVFSKGMYLVDLRTESEQLSSKFIIQ